MENPCDKCLIKVNCTEVCFPKKNYGVLIERSSEEYWKIIITSNNPTYRKRFKELKKKITDHRNDETEIFMREMGAKLQL